MKALLSVIWWAVFTLVLACLFLSLSYRFDEALFIATLYLPSAVILLEELLIFLAHLIVLAPPENPFSVSTPVLIYNPVLSIIILGAGYCSFLLLERVSNRWLPKKEPTITFTSDRQKVSVLIDSISYIESRDKEVYVHLADGTAYRNKTPITHWESILGSGFLRVHRAYLVNANRIKQTTPDALLVDADRIPVSRTYRESIKDIL